MASAGQNKIYLFLLATQTAAATFLFWVIFPLFHQMITQIGKPQDVSHLIEVEICLGTVVLHGAYWARYRWVTLQAPFHSPFIGHLVQFASRVSFFFGGAVFSALFFRHLPELDTLPSIDQTLVKGLVVLGVLFALFCYSLELDRLGKAIEDTPDREILPPGQHVDRDREHELD
ncbi:hypothetical protein [Bosea sp. PAMC 26642]|uniref:hypothetical protein n=1 Tax=Bosea sp. (strain PAMC 26642) TaxID=1792307 RepID=UPI00076FE01E|nr:hypothetical protein [Bosea sp. PAMC 26642]AMJ62016.1 hypothetical protein AXW83_18435 [Bosea sp. PAMC 26642]